MPELPEVETTRRGIHPHIFNQAVTRVVIRNHSLRWPVDQNLHTSLKGRTLVGLSRRGKYLIFDFEDRYLLCHLGMSGSLRIAQAGDVLKTHDHVDICFSNHNILRYHDPRRFGAVLYTREPPLEHKLLRDLGPEPLSDAFTAEHLFLRSRKIQQPVKSWIMNSKVVVGVGNIYANESLFNAGIHPLTPAKNISRARYQVFHHEIVRVLRYAIERGGTTLRDFVGGDGKPGYFAQELNVYGQGGKPCTKCQKALTERVIAQRATVYCTNCQKRS